MTTTTETARFLAHLRAGRPAKEVKAVPGDLTISGAYALPRALADAIAAVPASAYAIPRLVARARAGVESYTETVETHAARYHWLGDATTGDAPTLAGIVPTPGEIVCEFEVSRRLMECAAYDMEAAFVASAAGAFAEAEAVAFLAGNGERRPTGLVEAITTTPAAGDLGASLLALRNTVPVQHRAHWVMPGVVFDMLDPLPAFAPADNHGPARLHGIPVEVDEACQRAAAPAVLDGEGATITPAIEAAGLVLLGNLEAAFRAVDIVPAGSPSPVEVMLDPYTHTGWIGVRITKRVAGITRRPEAVAGIEVAL